MEFFLMIALYAVIAAHVIPDDNIENLLNDSMTLINNFQYEESLVYLDRILAIDENNLQALANKGGVLLKLGKYDESIEYFDKAIKIKPDFVEALNNKAIALYYLGKYEESSVVLYQASKIDPTNKITIENIALVLDKIPFIKETGYAKIEVRDKNKNLVAYTEAYHFFLRYPLGNKVIEETEWNDVEIKGQKLQQLENTWNFTINKTELYSRTDISLNLGEIGFRVVQIPHDGFLVTEGDEVKITLDIFRVQ
jgi:tetratricopeptide (TPR) repeat protein